MAALDVCWFLLVVGLLFGRVLFVVGNGSPVQACEPVVRFLAGRAAGLQCGEIAGVEFDSYLALLYRGKDIAFFAVLLEEVASRGDCRVTC